MNSPDIPLPETIEHRLRLLTRVAELLDIDDVSFARFARSFFYVLQIVVTNLFESSYAAAIARLSSDRISLKRSLNRLDFVENELRTHLASARHEERLIKKWTKHLENEEKVGETSATLDRRREALVKKAKEYRDELDAMTAEGLLDPPITITDLINQQEKNRRKEQDLKAKRAKIKAFQGLPPNLDLARNELKNARNEQMKLIQLRERLLGRMAEGVA